MASRKRRHSRSWNSLPSRSCEGTDAQRADAIALSSMVLSSDLMVHRSGTYRFMPAVSVCGLVEHCETAGAFDAQRLSRVSGDMCATRLHVHCIEGLARRHEQAIALGPTEAEIGADLRQADLADTGAVGRKNMYAVIAVAHPSHAGPDVAVLVAADTIGEARLAVERHFGKGFTIFEVVAFHVVQPASFFGI